LKRKNHPTSESESEKSAAKDISSPSDEDFVKSKEKKTPEAATGKKQEKTTTSKKEEEELEKSEKVRGRPAKGSKKSDTLPCIILFIIFILILKIFKIKI
jgi:hypothetical protein